MKRLIKQSGTFTEEIPLVYLNKDQDFICDEEPNTVYTVIKVEPSKKNPGTYDVFYKNKNTNQEYKMNVDTNETVKKAKKIVSHYNNDILNLDEYKTYKTDLNWRDDGNGSPDGQGVDDPSMNDFIKGYQQDPYSLRYWAKTKADRKLMKLAWKEVDVLSFSPEYLADKILKLWNQIDGTLQNTFEAFTLRYDNKLKQEIANILNKQGYEVYPILLVDCPMYANKNKIIKVIGNTPACKHLRSDLQYMAKTTSYRLFTKKANMIIDFYKRTFANDKYIQNI